MRISYSTYGNYLAHLCDIYFIHFFYPGLLEKFMVGTPAKNEKRQVARKRKAYNKDYICNPTDRKDRRQVKRRGALVLCDENIVLPNE